MSINPTPSDTGGTKYWIDGTPRIVGRTAASKRDLATFVFWYNGAPVIIGNSDGISFPALFIAP